MHVVYSHCCGLDVHKRSITTCLLLYRTGGKGHQEFRRFGTMTRDLLELADWLHCHQVTHVAMDSTGVYWKPVWNILEGQCEVVVVNAQHIKAVPGRKTDIKDCQWIAELLQHELVRGSFVRAASDPAVAGSDADARQSPPGSHSGGQADAEDSRGRQYQVSVSCQ